MLLAKKLKNAVIAKNVSAFTTKNINVLTIKKNTVPAKNINALRTKTIITTTVKAITRFHKKILNTKYSIQCQTNLPCGVSQKIET